MAPTLAELQATLEEALRVDDRIVSRVPLRVAIENAIIALDEIQTRSLRSLERTRLRVEEFKERHPLKDY
jgi:hypothetical protein